MNGEGFKEELIEQSERFYPGNTGKLYEMTLVNELARGNKDFILSLTKIFIDTVPATASEMVEACNKQEWERLSKLAHKMKSTVDTMCMVSIKEDIRTIEADAKHKVNITGLASLVKKIDWTISRATQQMKEEFSLN